MLSADGIILGSPVYSADVTATMKAFLERAGVVVATNPGLLKHRVGASVAAVRRGGGMTIVDTMKAEYFVVLKCNPEKSVELREKYQDITKGFYAGGSLMWNSVYIQKDVPDALIVELIGHSVEEVLTKLSKKRQEEYRAL